MDHSDRSRLVSPRRFRAAFDFLCLRAIAEQDAALQADAEWWEEFQKATEERQVEMSQAVPHVKKKRRRIKRRKSNGPAE